MSVVLVGRHRKSPSSDSRASRGLRGDGRRRAERDRTAPLGARPKRSGGWRRGGHFASRCKEPQVRRKIAAPPPLPSRSVCRSRPLPKARARGVSKMPVTMAITRDQRHSPLSSPYSCIRNCPASSVRS
ncbi:hypothetical protein SFOMI_0690 [Sphingobium fuliginis]|uniref:Uncharacterized protein n=1 Tax=Sphingobium fuliginis (strain ATCC 27551) TaxID=336203 RepID=A0A292ZAK6_SPHSA|nr:hypothetical protein SFOMI_0690 [Sphingobium fuliginis]